MHIKNLELVIPVISLVGIIHILIIARGFINNDTDYRYHHYDGWVGIVLVILRLITLGFFLFFINGLIGSVKGKVQDFLSKL